MLWRPHGKHYYQPSGKIIFITLSYNRNCMPTAKQTQITIRTGRTGLDTFSISWRNRHSVNRPNSYVRDSLQVQWLTSVTRLQLTYFESYCSTWTTKKSYQLQSFAAARSAYKPVLPVSNNSNQSFVNNATKPVTNDSSFSAPKSVKRPAPLHLAL